MTCFRSFFAAFVALTFTCIASAQPAAPAFSSRPGAAYTLYLNFTGFNYTGSWGGQTPGNVVAYNGQAGPTFTIAEQASIKNIWSRVSESYFPFNINVTTVDPAAAAGNSTYLARQHYYDTTARVMHSVIGNGNAGFFNGAGGVSYVGTWATSNSAGSGYGTNWSFTNRLGGYSAYHNIFTATVHENGHAAGLSHQGDYIGSTLVNSYSTNNGSSVLAPSMGVGYSASRDVFAVGRINTNTSTIQNDALRILQNSGMGGFINDGIGRTLATASPLALNGALINSLNNQGVIVPVSDSNPNPIGASNYTKGFYSFSTAVTGVNTITVNAGTQFLTPGAVDPHASLDSTLRLLDNLGNQLAIASTSSLGETISINLGAGQYFIEVSSAGGKQASLGPTNNWAARQFYDMGAYFLTGSIQSVPEPGSLALMSLVVIGIVVYRRRVR